MNEHVSRINGPCRVASSFRNGFEVGTNGGKLHQFLQPDVVIDRLELDCKLLGLGAEASDQDIDDSLRSASRAASRVHSALSS